MRKISVANGIAWVEIPEADLRILCGCPPDSVKHLMRKGLIAPEEKSGVVCETGPNAILLADVSLAGQRFANLAEFPVLQMLYRQGMMLPGHPNNTGRKPLLIGVQEEVRAQAEYIFRGNYGLASVEELIDAGVRPEDAQEMMRVKRRFAFERIRKTEDLLDLRIVADEPVELRHGAVVCRRGVNRYEFRYGDERVAVDINLAPGQEYQAPYQLGFHRPRREYFAVIHSGEGDGWDANQPCMASILTFQGRIYLIDAGPNLLDSLAALGIGVSEVEGIFHTHAHDDHFAGLAVLMRSDHRIQYYAAPYVRRSAMEKVCALTGMPREDVGRYLDIRDLRCGEYNDIEGLEVMPVYSPHPVETTVLFFRALWEDGYKTYAHLADLSSLDALQSMQSDDPTTSGLSSAWLHRARQTYLTPADVKKIDVGGGMIHGRAEDFRADRSRRIVLSHTALPLTDSQKEVGDSAAFGVTDTLIPAGQDYTKSAAFGHMRQYFPDAPAHELRMLLNCPVESFSPGTIAIHAGEANRSIFFVLSGIMELIQTERGINNKLTAGAMAGEISGLLGTESRGTFRAVSYVSALRISASLYAEFLRRNGALEETRRDIRLRAFLQETWLFGDFVSCPVKNRIGRAMREIRVPGGEFLRSAGEPELFLLREGAAEIMASGKTVERLGPGGFFGTEAVLFGEHRLLAARTTEESTLLVIPAAQLDGIPSVRWKLRETLERRRRLVGPEFGSA